HLHKVLLSRHLFPQHVLAADSTPSFFFHHPATPERYTLSLHDALPIFARFIIRRHPLFNELRPNGDFGLGAFLFGVWSEFVEKRSEEHTSELQSRGHLVCRLLLEKKKKNKKRR